MKKLLIDKIRRELSKAPDNESELNEYFESLNRDHGEFLSYILSAGLTLKNIIKLFGKSDNIEFCKKLIDRFYDPDTYFSVLCSSSEVESARALIIQTARFRKKNTVKIFHEKQEYIETIKLN